MKRVLLIFLFMLLTFSIFCNVRPKQPITINDIPDVIYVKDGEYERVHKNSLWCVGCNDNDKLIKSFIGEYYQQVGYSNRKGYIQYVIKKGSKAKLKVYYFHDAASAYGGSKINRIMKILEENNKYDCTYSSSQSQSMNYNKNNQYLCSYLTHPAFKTQKTVVNFVNDWQAFHPARKNTAIKPAYKARVA